jgi:hypothetical protein
VGYGSATTGATTGVLAKVFSLDGIALIADNTTGGKIFSGLNNGVEKASVGGNGNGYFAGKVGIGTTTPGQKLSVVGAVESTTGGFKFPDGTIQTTAGGLGTVTSISTGAGLTGGPITTSGTISIAAGGVVNSMLASNSVTNFNIAGGSIAPGKINGIAATLTTGNIFAYNQVISSTGVALTANGTGAGSIGVEGTSDDGPGGTGSAGYFLNSAGGRILVAKDGSSTVLRVDTYGLRLERPIVNNIGNNSTTGTVLNELAKFNPDGTVSVTGAGDLGGAIGVVVSGAGTSGTSPDAIVGFIGVAPCVFDNTAVEADYVTISRTAAGKCHDAGSAYPSGVQVLGRVVDTGSSPPSVYSFGTEARGAGPDGLILPAVTFSGISGNVTLSQGLVAGSGGTLDGWAPVILPQGTAITGFKVCGRDFGDPDQFIGKLKRKKFSDSTATFTAPDVLASLSSGAVFSADALTCPQTSSITNPLVDNANYAYYAEIELQGPVQMVSVEVDH